MAVEGPLVSVVIPCYNHAEFVQETIQSVIKQTYGNMELIIIDDGSSDHSVRKIEEMAPECRERFTNYNFVSRENKGLSATLNEALAMCRGHFLVCVASDDILVPEKTDTQVAYLQAHPNCAGVFGGFCFIFPNGTTRKKVKSAKRNTFRQILLHKHELPALTQMLRMSDVRSVGGYNEAILIEDWAMWLSLTKNGKTLDYLPKIMGLYRIHDSNMSSQLDDMHRARLQIVSLFAEQRDIGIAKAMTYLQHAHCVQRVSKRESVRWAGVAVQSHLGCIFTRSFIAYVVKFCMNRRR